MPDASMKSTAQPVNDALLRARKQIVLLQQKVAKLHLEIGDQVEELMRHLPPEALAGTLAAECRIPSDLVPTYLHLSETLAEHRVLVQHHGVSISVIKDLVSAEPAARQIMLMRIASGRLVLKGQASAISRDLKAARMSASERENASRSRSLRRSAGRSVAPSILAFESSVREFAEQIFQFFIEHARDVPFQKFWKIDPTNTSYRDAHAALRSMAVPILAEFERLHGNKHPGADRWEHLAGRWPSKVKIARAHLALVRFAEGRFCHSGGFTFQNTRLTTSGFDMWEALQYLSTDKIALPLGTDGQPTYPSRLTSLELCAGIGGQALGLSSSGFQLQEVFEKSRCAAAVLRKNRPSWNTSEVNLTESPDNVFGRHTDRIDLISGGLPCQPYSGRGKGRGKGDPRDLFPISVEIVGIVRPKAFFFENVEGFTYIPHNAHRAEILNGFRSNGYDIQMHRINAGDFGLPQDRVRVIVLGIRPDIAHRFQMPAPLPGPRTTIGPVLQDVLFPYRTAPEARARRTAMQENYDDWADDWLDRHGGKLAPTVTRLGGASKYLTSWTNAGFDAQKLARAPLRPDHMKRKGYLPHPTISVLKRLQGIPDCWTLKGSTSTQVQQLANAFPPQAAKAIGLALHFAISGETVDIAEAMARPLNPRRINLNALANDDVKFLSN